MKNFLCSFWLELEDGELYFEFDTFGTADTGRPQTYWEPSEPAYIEVEGVKLTSAKLNGTEVDLKSASPIWISNWECCITKKLQEDKKVIEAFEEHFCEQYDDSINER